MCNLNLCPYAQLRSEAYYLASISIYSTVCKDEHHSTAQCEGWVKNGFCKKGAKYFTWMRENCMKSCGVCSKN